MRLFARRVKHPLDVMVQRSNDADAREHRWTVMFCNQQKRPHRGLPFGTMFCLGPITSVLAPLRHADRLGRCLLMGVNRKSSADGQNGAFDPTETSPGNRLNAGAWAGARRRSGMFKAPRACGLPRV